MSYETHTIKVNIGEPVLAKGDLPKIEVVPLWARTLWWSSGASARDSSHGPPVTTPGQFAGWAAS